MKKFKPETSSLEISKRTRNAIDTLKDESEVLLDESRKFIHSIKKSAVNSSEWSIAEAPEEYE